MQANCKVKVVADLAGVFPNYQPVVGQVYNANYIHSKRNMSDMCIIRVNGKFIVMHAPEYEVLEWIEDDEESV